MAIDLDTRIPDARTILAQMTGVLLPPLAMLAGMEASYAAVSRGCQEGTELIVHVVHAVTLLLVVGAGVIAHREWKAAGGAEPGDGGSRATRGRLLGWIGMFCSLLFIVIVLAQWMPSFFLSPCQ